MQITRTALVTPLLTGLLFGLSACGDVAQLPVSAGIGPDPTLPPPRQTLIPTVKTSPAVGWTSAARPAVAEGLQVTAYASGLAHPRWLYRLPNGDVLVAEGTAPPKGDTGFSIKRWVAKIVMKNVGASVPSPNRITLLRDADGDGKAELRSTLLEGLHSPFGMALIGNDLYVANADAIVRFPYQSGQTQISAAGKKVIDLPGLPLNHHWTKNIIASQDGSKLYATVGSNSNIGENGMDIEQGRAAIWEIDLQSRAHRIFASGLRNPNGMMWEPQTGSLWTVVNERDEIGSDLVPDYLTSVKDGGFYGWPYSYYGNVVDERVKPQQPELVAKAIKPDYALGAHTASLGLSWAEGDKLPQQFRSGAFIGQHGSWNRNPQSGYKVIFVPFKDGKPAGEPVDVLTSFLSADGKAQGRPVGVAFDAYGALLVADDVGKTIWHVTAKAN
ncbi:PQQ-dependent sugar dehydrogenase [Methylobacillus flagellatus]|uniref:PQQ-dependent sugar dehydrogenase n=1 Tax=Methylobacillus flagellatus TaxID=405 RepID=UPI0010F8CBCB|nr:sorbosone dehydrogenase family protein [Methylobacillus flagellatus]